MTENQRMFCDEYLKDRNATRAYKIAYPHIKNERSARTLASRLLTKVDVRAYIDEQLQKISDESIADTKEIMKYFTSVLRGESQSEVLVVLTKQEGGSEAKKIMKAADEKERLKAAEMLGKCFGMFKDKVDVSSSNVIIVDNVPEDW